MKTNWQQRLDELELQLRLGMMEGRQAFEDQKAKFRDVVSKARQLLDNPEGLSENIRTRFQQQLDEAEVQLALGKAEGKEAFAEQKKLIDNALKDLQETIREIRQRGNNEWKEKAGDISAAIQTFRIQLDIFSIYFALGKAEAEDKAEAFRDEMKKKIAELRGRVNEWTDDDNWEDFAEELKTSVVHLGRAFRKLFA